MRRSIRIVIADDHLLMLDGLATLIQSIDGFDLVGKVSSGKELLALLEKIVLLPDICIVDIEMPGMNGVETVKAIRQKFNKIKIMTLTMHNESHFVNRMIAAGANGYLLKNVDRDIFIASIHKIMNGTDFVTMAMNERLNTPPLTVSLTDRETEILKFIAQGKSNKEIAEELFISDRTADTHRTNIKRKLNLSSLAQLIQYAKEHGIVD